MTIWGPASVQAEYTLASVNAANSVSGAYIGFSYLLTGENRGYRRDIKTFDRLKPIEDFFREDHPLLTNREKQILTCRFNMRDDPVCPTLESVGRTVGLSKERVRQLQASAILKLRLALSVSPSAM